MNLKKMEMKNYCLYDLITYLKVLQLDDVIYEKDSWWLPHGFSSAEKLGKIIYVAYGYLREKNDQGYAHWKEVIV